MWITQPAAAEILGVHPQTVAKLVARGDLTSRGQSGVRGSLDRDEVLALAVARREAAERRQREREAATSPWSVRSEEPPDAEHVWLRTREAAEFMGVSQPAISQRARKGRLPFVEHAGRRWFRRDHLELVKHADLVKRPTRAAPPALLGVSHFCGGGPSRGAHSHQREAFASTAGSVPGWSSVPASR